MPMPESVDTPKSSRFLALAAMCGVVAGLYFARAVLIPLAVALLIAFLLAPLVRRLERFHLRRTPSALIVVAFSFLIIASIGWIISEQARDLAIKLGDYQADIEQKIRGFHGYFGHGVWARASSEIETISRDVATTQPSSSLQSWAPRGTQENPVAVQLTSAPETSGALETLSSTLYIIAPMAQTIVVIAFVIFMLIQREDIRDRIISLIGQGRLTVTTRAFDDAATRISSYLAAQSIVNGTFAVLVALGLYLIHIPNAPLWGLLCGLLRFIPYVGIWIGALFPIILSVVMPQDYYAWRPFLTIGLFVVLEVITANAIEPLLFASRTGLSPLAILVAAVFWTWLWGPIGLLLATPLTVLLAVAGKYVPQMKFLDTLLGDQPVLQPPERYYQRLLAEDAEEAEDLLEEFQQTRTREQLFAQIMLPVLAMARRDFRGGILGRERFDFILEVMIDEIQNLSIAQEKDPAAPVQPPDVPKDFVVRVVCMPAHDRAEEVAALMLAGLLRDRGYTVTTVSAEKLASESVEIIDREMADVALVSTLPPGAVTHARYACKRIRAKLPEIHIVVGLWQAQGLTDKLGKRFAAESAVQLVTQFDEALRAIHQLVQPLLIRPSDQPTSEEGKGGASSHTARSLNPQS
jgi:predicted PurR-regulated permease PerM/CheY-like chemotaxis protein